MQRMRQRTGRQVNKAAEAGRNITAISELAERRSPIHDLAPLAKLTLTVVYILLTVSFHKYDLSGLFVMLLFPVLGFAVSGTPVRLCFYKLRYVLPLVLAVGLLNPFFDRAPLFMIAGGRILFGSAAAAASGGFTVTGGMISMITLMLKGIFCLMASFLLAATTPVEEIAAALRRIHVPKTLTALFLLTFRYTGVLLDEVAVMTDAYHLRAPRQRGIAVKAWGSFLGQLILRSMDRASALYDSMLLRGFNGNFYYAERGKSGGLIVTLAAAAMMCLVRFVNLPALLSSAMMGL